MYCGVLNRVAVCCSVLQCVAVCCSDTLAEKKDPLVMCLRCIGWYFKIRSVLQCVAVCCSVLACVAACRSVLQCAAVCCSVLQCVAKHDKGDPTVICASHSLRVD